MADKQERRRLQPFSGPTTALLWEQWRLLVPFLGAIVFAAAAGSLGLYTNMVSHMVQRQDALGLTDFARRLASIILPGLCCVNFAGGVSFPQRLYRLPVTTRRMVLYVAVPRLIFLLLTLLVLLGFRMLLFGAPDWDSEVRMAVLSMLATAAAMGLSWALAGTGKDWPAVLGEMVIIGMAWALYDILGNTDVREFIGPDILWPLAGFWLLFWVLVVFAGPNRARSGVSLLRRLRRGGPVSARPRTVPVGPNRLPRFSSPFEAQIWYERRTRGYAGLLYPLLFAVFVVLALSRSNLLMWISYSYMEPLSLAIVVAALSVGLCFIVAAARRLVEAYRVRTGRFRFLAAKPMSTQDFARARFYSMTRGVETAVVFGLALAAFVWLLPPMPLLLTPSLWPLWLADAHQSIDSMAATLLLAWVLVLWLCASLTAYSTPKALALLFAWPLLQLGTTYEPVRLVMEHGGNEAAVALTGLLLMGHVARMFRRARAQGLLSPVSVLLCAAAFLILAPLLARHLALLVTENGYDYRRTDHLAWTVEFLGVVSLIVAPVAALPLQFDRWRHGGK